MFLGTDNQSNSSTSNLKYAVDPNKMQFDYHESLSLYDKEPKNVAFVSNQQQQKYQQQNNHKLNYKQQQENYHQQQTPYVHPFHNKEKPLWEEYDEFHQSIMDTTSHYGKILKYFE